MSEQRTLPDDAPPAAWLDEVFWPLVERTNGCWLWGGGKSGGYGQIRSASRMYMAHRLAYEVVVGPIPMGTELHHVCEVKSCVNPAHLRPVTRSEHLRLHTRKRPSRLPLTHCRAGHPLDDVNAYNRPDGGRGCRTCRAAASRRYRAQQALRRSAAGR